MSSAQRDRAHGVHMRCILALGHRAAVPAYFLRRGCRRPRWPDQQVRRHLAPIRRDARRLRPPPPDRSLTLLLLLMWIAAPPSYSFKCRLRASIRRACSQTATLERDLLASRRAEQKVEIRVSAVGCKRQGHMTSHASPDIRQQVQGPLSEREIGPVADRL